VLSHEAHKPIAKQGGTSYYFVTAGIESALKRAEEAADGKDIMVLGGANAAQPYLKAGLLDEINLHSCPYCWAKTDISACLGILSIAKILSC
jgi:dihydrofolate reductase